MPGIITPRARSASEFDEDDEVSQDGAVTPMSQQSAGTKRRRVDYQEHVETSPALVQRNRSNMAKAKGSLANGQDHETHAPGAIVRIKVTNFVSYTSAEFHCGPSLNMIIGPNGTGKSTLVCAICLGLGWSPSCLGRAKEIGEFVKHGRREAEIEVELAAGPAQKGRNPIIRRLIKREGNKSAWWINGRQTTHKDVLALARSFRIQIDNLCQFLPQDRVVEFAAMNPIQLLESTQKAVASEQMTQWHDRLKELATHRARKTEEQKTSHGQLTELRNRQNQQRAEVERMNERRDLMEKLSGLKKARVVIQYKSEREKREATKARLDAAKRELAELKQELAPALGRIEAKEGYLKKVNGLAETKRKMLDVTSRKAKNAQQHLNNYGAKFAELRQQYDAEGIGKKKLRDEVKRHEAQIRTVENRMVGRAPEIDLDDFRARLAEVDRERKSQGTRATELKDLLNRYKRQLEERDGERSQYMREHEQLKTHAGQQWSKLVRTSPDTVAAVQWLRKNEDKFEAKVYGPPMLECSVKDPKYADAMEALLQAGDFLALTVTNTADYRKLLAHLYTKQDRPVVIKREPGGLFPDGYDPGVNGLGLGNIYVRVAKQSLDRWQPPMSAEQLAEYNLDDWALNLLQGPEPVLSMLCAEKFLHKTAVGLRRQTPQQFERLKRPDSGVSRFVAGQELYAITRRAEYGPGAESIQVQTISKAQFFVEQGGDSSAQAELRKQINTLASEITELQAQRQEAAQEFDEMRKKNDEFNERKATIEQEKKELQKAIGEWNLLPQRIEKHQNAIAGLQRDIDLSDDKRRQLQSEQEQLALDRAQHAIAYSKIMVALRKCHADVLDVEIWAIEAMSEVDNMKDQHSESQGMVKEREQEIQHFTKVDLDQRDKARRLAEQVQELRANATDEEMEIVQELAQSDKTLDDLEADILAMTGRIELLHEGNPQAIQQFEARQKKIDVLEERLRTFESDLQQWNDQITQLRQQWEPRLDQVIAKISDAFAFNFQQIGCAGQVGVHKDEEDFGQWAIKIEVKFRENEQLAQLDSHRQSGGERAVSTIFYLMALQSLAQAPFRVVDEINQGMDPRNERMVHERMVDIACSENTSQYFLITPKLLNGLKYHERMSVHTIYSGETMPEDNAGLDFRKLADVALKVAGKVH